MPCAGRASHRTILSSPTFLLTIVVHIAKCRCVRHAAVLEPRANCQLKLAIAVVELELVAGRTLGHGINVQVSVSVQIAHYGRVRRDSVQPRRLARLDEAG